MQTIQVGLLARALSCLLAFCSLSAMAETAIERGAYLVRGIAACGNCHTQKGPEGDVPGMELGGMLYKDADGTVLYAFPNITPDPETGIGNWTDEQIVTAIREGRRPDGRIMGPPMPFELYRNLSDSDVNAIVAFLRSLPPVQQAIPRPQAEGPAHEPYGPPVNHVPDVSRDDPVSYGEYLVGPVGHCIECHTPGTHETIDYANSLGAGGRVFKGPWGESVSLNLTPTGLSRWTDDEVKQMISQGIRPDGSPMMPPMGYAYYANISDADLDAIVAYLRSLPAK